MLLIAHNRHTETHFIFSIFVTMTGPSSIYVILCDLFFIFTHIFIIINHTLKQTHLFLAHFLGYLKLVLDDNVDEKSK